VQVDPLFLVPWVRAELEARGEAHELAALSARAAADGLDADDAEFDAASELFERRGLRAAMDLAAGELGEVIVRESRGASEWVERPSRAPGQHDLFGELGPAACTAFLRPAAGAASRLAHLAQRLAEDPEAQRVENALLGGTSGCAAR
jgi:hypothetical protein